MGPLLLLPPSESKHPGGTGAWDPATGRLAALGTARAEVAAALAAEMADPARVAKLTGLRNERALAAADANRGTLGGAVLPARERYRGVVWEHLDPAGLNRVGRRRAAGILVVSGLGGLFGWDDPVPDYKLKMGAALAATGPLARFWKPYLTAALAEHAAGAAVWDLLPGEHRRALDLPAAGVKAVTVNFLAAGGSGAAGHGAKAVKGRFARHLLEVPGDPLDAAAGFRWEGWNARVETAELVTVTAPDARDRGR